MTLLFHLYNHAGSEEELLECAVDNLPLHLNWEQTYTAKLIRCLDQEGYVQISDGLAKLTDAGQNASIRNYNALFSS